MKKAYSVLRRDLKISLKDPMALWMILMPLLLALLIVWIAPGITETVPTLAVEASMDEAFVPKTLREYAGVETLPDAQAVQERVLLRRDEVLGLINAAKTAPCWCGRATRLKARRKWPNCWPRLPGRARTPAAAENTAFGFYSFRDETSPLKRALSITLLIMISVITAMLISLGLVDEKERPDHQGRQRDAHAAGAVRSSPKA